MTNITLLICPLFFSFILYVQQSTSKNQNDDISKLRKTSIPANDLAPDSGKLVNMKKMIYLTNEKNDDSPTGIGLLFKKPAGEFMTKKEKKEQEKKDEKDKCFLIENSLFKNIFYFLEINSNKKDSKSDKYIIVDIDITLCSILRKKHLLLLQKENLTLTRLLFETTKDAKLYISQQQGIKEYFKSNLSENHLKELRENYDPKENVIYIGKFNVNGKIKKELCIASDLLNQLKIKFNFNDYTNKKNKLFFLNNKIVSDFDQERDEVEITEECVKEYTQLKGVFKVEILKDKNKSNLTPIDFSEDKEIENFLEPTPLVLELNSSKEVKIESYNRNKRQRAELSSVFDNQNEPKSNSDDGKQKIIPLQITRSIEDITENNKRDIKIPKIIIHRENIENFNEDPFQSTTENIDTENSDQDNIESFVPERPNAPSFGRSNNQINIQGGIHNEAEDISGFNDNLSVENEKVSSIEDDDMSYTEFPNQSEPLLEDETKDNPQEGIHNRVEDISVFKDNLSVDNKNNFGTQISLDDTSNQEFSNQPKSTFSVEDNTEDNHPLSEKNNQSSEISLNDKFPSTDGDLKRPLTSPSAGDNKEEKEVKKVENTKHSFSLQESPEPPLKTQEGDNKKEVENKKKEEEGFFSTILGRFIIFILIVLTTFSLLFLFYFCIKISK